jgi:hypothetical protein
MASTGVMKLIFKRGNDGVEEVDPGYVQSVSMLQLKL